MTRKQIQKKVDAIFAVSLVLTAIVSISSVNAEQAEPIIPEKPICEFTTLPTIEETVEPTQEPTETEPPVAEATEPSEAETEPQVILYDVPLSEELQIHIINLCERFNIDPAVVLAQIWKESNFNSASVGDGGDSIGLMQIQSKWHSGWMEQLRCPDLFDPFQNVTVGIHILADHLNHYEGNLEMALVAYNAGRSGAEKHWFSQGEYSSDYSRAVMKKAEELRLSK